ncbi:ABC transporter ATP-binding protein [Leptolyngbya ohadii]|uniref:ABC transporter ATP-binding protein n=1 Tax=Leptolyngbya ohadii TaxID=1962290 RepID=UPI000B5A2006|nr:ABC transporter ATP-binding protein [Leptolyngbya ohadii]
MLYIHDLHKSYGARSVLRGLSLSIAPGEVYGLLGPNGAGKTTTINILCNLLHADSGTIRVNQQPITHATKSLIGIAPQENLIYRSLTCAENLNFFAQIYGLSRAARKRQIDRALTQVGLIDRAHSVAETLSGGMQRRLSLAIALVHQPKLLILDEPTTGLDIETRFEVWRLIQTLQQQGMTILLTTHLLDEAERLCDRIGILKQGQIIAEGSFPQLRQHIPAEEILLIQTPDESAAIDRAQTLGYPMRRYGNALAFWLPQSMPLKEIIDQFEGISLDSIARQPVRLEHIYIELMQSPDRQS